MNRRISLLVLAAALAAIISACSSPTPGPVTPRAAAPSAPNGPAPTRTLVPLPPQPTSGIALAPSTAQPYLSPTPAIQVSGGTPIAVFGGSSAVPTAAPPAAQAAAPAAPTSAPAPAVAGPVPTAPGVATGKRSEAKFAFVTPLTPAEEAEPADLVSMRAELKKLPGFLEVSDIEDGKGALVGYDAGLITPEQLMVRFAALGHPVTRQ